MPLPIVENLTQTADDAIPITQKIGEIIAKRERKGSQLIRDGLSSFRRAADVENNTGLRTRLLAAITMVEGE